MSQSFPARPSASQADSILRTLRASELVYNHFLILRLRAWSKHRARHDLSWSLRKLRSYKEMLPHLSETDDVVYKKVLARQEGELSRYFDAALAGKERPKLRVNGGKKIRTRSYPVPGPVEIGSRFVRIPSLGILPCSVPPEARSTRRQQAAISLHPDGSYTIDLG